MSDILTQDELDQARKLYADIKKNNSRYGNPYRSFPKEFSEKVIKPNISRINKATGQENAPMYLAYMLEHFLNQLEL